LHDDNDIIDLSSDGDLDDDEALEKIIKNKQEEADVFKDLPLFDVDILNNFIDEWFQDPSLSLDDLQLPIGISVTFEGFIAKEIAIAQKVIEQKNKIKPEKVVFEKHMDKLSAKEIQSFKQMMADMKEEFQRRRDDAKRARDRLKHYAEKCVQAQNEGLKRTALGRPAIDPKLDKKKKKKKKKKKPTAPAAEAPR
jgi:hypothetical protein